VNLWIYIFSFLALIINLGLTPLIIKLSHKNKWYDSHDDRKIHDGLIPRIGGIGIYIAFLIVVILGSILTDWGTQMNLVTWVLLLTGLTVMNIVGIIDDFHTIRAIYKLGGQILAAILIVAGGLSFKTLDVPFLWIQLPLGNLGPIITVIWLLAMSNAINLMDGMDGLAGGISFWASVGVGAIALYAGNMLVALFALSLAGALGGFLFYNLPRPRAKIFMGDSGALTIGYIIGVLPLLYNPGQTTTVELYITSTLLMFPILDTIAAILRRIRDKKPIHMPDREHLHHKFLDLGLKPSRILTIIYSVSIINILGCMTWEIFPRHISVWILISLWIIGISFFLVLDQINKSRKQNESNQQSP